MANSYVEYTATGTGTNGLGQQTFSYAGVEVLNANDIKVFGQKIDGTKEELRAEVILKRLEYIDRQQQML
jgi:hypothetical protein